MSIMNAENCQEEKESKGGNDNYALYYEKEAGCVTKHYLEKGIIINEVKSLKTSHAAVLLQFH